MTRVLVTGATGFIGSHVVAALVEAGHEVTALVRPGSDAGRLSALLPRIGVLRGDLLAHPSLAAARPEACVHLAWYVEPGKYLWSERNLDCLADSLRFGWELLEAGCRHLLVAGTCFEYRPASAPLHEDAPLRPETLYAGCKLALSQAFEPLARRRGAALTSLRFFYLYGPHEDPRRLVPLVIRNLLTGQEVITTPGEQVRDYLHVADAARGVVAAVEGHGGGPLNIASGEPVTIKKLLFELANRVGRPELLRIGGRPYDPGDPMYVCGDSARLRSLGWQPRFSLADGLADSAAWWRARMQAGHGEAG